jgi:uncharacterized protein (DUF2062 family)
VLSNIRSRLDRLSTTEGSPRRTAAALALGVFLSFSPFLGLQILLGLAAAFVFRLSRVAVLIGLCANLPWIMLPWYALTTTVAAQVLGYTSPLALDARMQGGLFSLLKLPFRDPSWDRTGAIATALFWPFLIGPTLAAMVPAAAAYILSFRMLARRRAGQASSPPDDGLAGDAQQRAADGHVDDAERARLEP